MSQSKVYLVHGIYRLLYALVMAFSFGTVMCCNSVLCASMLTSACEELERPLLMLPAAGRRLKAVSEPFAYDEYRKKRLKEKIEEKRQSRIAITSKLPKVDVYIFIYLYTCVDCRYADPY